MPLKYVNLHDALPFLLVFGLTISLCPPLFSQICDFYVSGNRIVPKFDKTYRWEVNGAIFNDLSSEEQGVCAIEIEFEHNLLSDLQISLTSPAGQTVELVRDDFFKDTTICSKWKITFIPCKQVAAPEPGLSANFDDNLWPNGQVFSGTYFPASGCLEDFNKGKINGIWELKVSSQGLFSMGFLHSVKVKFWKDQGLYCEGQSIIVTPNRAPDNSRPLPPDLNSFLKNNISDTYADGTDMPLREKIANFGKGFVGINYRSGGQSPETGFDCSGFTHYVLKEFGVVVSPASKTQATEGGPVALNRVLPGDLIFFGENNGKISHVALVVKRESEDIFCVHSTTSRGVIVENVTQSKYWKPKIQFARNVLPWNF